MIQIVKIGNVGREDSPEAKAFAEALNGQTYMNFRVGFAPVGGSFDVLVSGYAESEEELRQMVLEFLSFRYMESFRK